MPCPLGNQIISSLPQAHPAATVALDAIQYLINSRPLRQPAQLTRQVLPPAGLLHVRNWRVESILDRPTAGLPGEG
jgi:hypothetical protein